MTCIVGLVEKDSVWMGGDACGIDGHLDRAAMVAPKVFRKEGRTYEVLIGYTSTFRFGQLLEHGLRLPSHPPREDEVERWVAVDFVDALRACVEGGGHMETESGRESCGTMLLAVAGRLFRIQGDFGFTECRRGYDAVGCGSGYAISSLFTSGAAGDIKPKKRVRLALEATEALNGGVMGPFEIQRLKPQKGE